MSTISTKPPSGTRDFLPDDIRKREYVMRIVREVAGLSLTEADRIRRAFSSFHNLTDADAIRLAASAQGILLRHLEVDAARAFQRALHAESVAAALVPESELRLLPDAVSLHRLELNPDSFVVFDLHGRAQATPWSELSLVAAGALALLSTTSACTFGPTEFVSS